MHRLLQSPTMQVETRYQVTPRVTSRIVRRTLRRVDPWSVLKFSLLFYFSVMLVFLFAGMILYFAASAAGIVREIEKFIQGVGWPEFRLHPVQVLRVGVLIGITQVIIWSTVNVFLAFLYNLVADVVGGIQITMSEREL